MSFRDTFMFNLFGFFRNRTATPARTASKAATYRNAVAIPEAEAAPEWIRIVPVGAFPNHHDGAHEITAQHVTDMATNFAAHAVDLLFDVDHESLWGNSRAAAWSDAVEAREDGLYCRYPVFTPRGQELIENRDYRYFSPVYVLDARDKAGREIGARVLSVALTNTPYMDAGEIDAVGNSAARAAAASETTNPTSTMTPELRAALIARYGLAADATDEQIQQAAQADATLATPVPDEAPDEAAPANAGGDSAQVPEADLVARVNSLQQRIDSLTQERADVAASQLVETALQDGKILPADRAVWLNAAKADYAGTKTTLDARKRNSALPSKIVPPPAEGKGNATSSGGMVNAAADFFKQQGRRPA